MSTTPRAPGDLISEVEVALLLGIAIATLRNWRAKKIGPRWLKIGERAVRYRQGDVEAFIDAGEQATQPSGRLDGQTDAGGGA